MPARLSPQAFPYGILPIMSEQPDIRVKPPCDRRHALAVLRRLREAGHVAYLAGGCVRDLLLGIEPKDYDIATDAPPKRVRQLFARTQAVGAAFGVVLVHEEGSVVEVATFRAEGNYLDGRHPSHVHFTTPQEDARRRDFTINGLFFDPLADQVIDYVGGQDDLKARRLRAIGNPSDRFREDHLRLLRAVRFAARFDLTIEPATADAIRVHAPMLTRISPERIADELRLMLTPPTRQSAWLLLWEFALVDVIFRFLPSAESLEFRRERSIFLAAAPGVGIPFGLALAAGALCYRWQSSPAATDTRTLLHRAEIQKMVRAMRQALRISNDESDQMTRTLQIVGPMLAERPPTLAMKKRFLASPASGLSRHLLDALAAIGQHASRIASLRDELAAIEQTEYAPAPFITGDDLTAAGLKPGPHFRHILDAVYDAQLEDRVHDRDEALQLAMELDSPSPREGRGPG